MYIYCYFKDDTMNSPDSHLQQTIYMYRYSLILKFLDLVNLKNVLKTFKTMFYLNIHLQIL